MHLYPDLTPRKGAQGARGKEPAEATRRPGVDSRRAAAGAEAESLGYQVLPGSAQAGVGGRDASGQKRR